MPFFAASILLQILCAIHVIRTGRNSLWIMVIVFFSLLGCAAYFAFEIMPTLGMNRHVRLAKANAVSKLDPERALRHAREQLDLADTVANRIALADACTDLGKHNDAVGLYREALLRVRGEDASTRAKYARSLFETGASAEALDALNALPESRNANDTDRHSLLRARILDDLGRKDDAIAIYEDVVTRFPGEEARCRYAALLIEAGETDRAQRLLEEVESRMKRLDRTQRAAEADMYDWAMIQLKAMRSLPRN
jgi:hypothetical protein